MQRKTYQPVGVGGIAGGTKFVEQGTVSSLSKFTVSENFSNLEICQICYYYDLTEEMYFISLNRLSNNRDARIFRPRVAGVISVKYDYWLSGLLGDGANSRAF